MLTVDLVRAHRRGSDLVLAAMKPPDRDRARELASRYLSIIEAHVGQNRGELDEALAAVQVGARDRKLAGGLRKLLLDRCHFEAAGEYDPVEVRRALFERASQARRASRVGDDFDRACILREVADTLEQDDASKAPVSADRVEQLMYADLKSSHHLLAVSRISADALVESYEQGQAQAVLLRARWVRARVFHARPSEVRALFRKLKFLRLLHTIEALDEDGYEIVIDGPYSMFRSVTKYGLALALMYPALRACDRWSLEAEVEWGQQRQPLRFRLHADTANQTIAPADTTPRLPDEVADLLRRFQEREDDDKTEWRAAVAGDILSLPGIGLCVPDLVFTHAHSGERVYLEVMGFWSRDAVWKRVEMVERGLPERVIFAVSSRLRVSEAALDPELPGALYVYKGAMSVSAIEERLRRLVRPDVDSEE